MLTDVSFCRMVTQNYTVPQTVTGTKTVNVTQPMQRTISKVIEGQKIVEQPHVLEYERPRMIPGRVINEGVMQTRVNPTPYTLNPKPIPGRVINEGVMQTRINIETLDPVARLRDLGIQWMVENSMPCTPNSQSLTLHVVSRTWASSGRTSIPCRSPSLKFGRCSATRCLSSSQS
jgi:hypothetical protein